VASICEAKPPWLRPIVAAATARPGPDRQTRRNYGRTVPGRTARCPLSESVIRLTRSTCRTERLGTPEAPHPAVARPPPDRQYSLEVLSIPDLARQIAGRPRRSASPRDGGVSAWMIVQWALRRQCGPLGGRGPLPTRSTVAPGSTGLLDNASWRDEGRG
jgi:hypothetical protein